MRVEYRLVLREHALARFRLRGQATVAQEARHEEQPGFGRGQIATADEAGLWCGEALVIAAADDRHRHATLDRAAQHLWPRGRGGAAVRRMAFEHEARERIAPLVALDQRGEIDLVLRI